MRALAAAALSLGLAISACSVDVEGAPCAAPGTTTDCPSGQACGVDQRCSVRAASCATRCAPGETRCADAQHLETCTTADAACGAWERRSCADGGFVCGTRGPAAACECPAGFAGPEFAADPVSGSTTSAAPFATGAATPAACRFKSLTAAVAQAATVAAQGGGTVQVYGDGAAVVFGSETGDGAITVPANVTVHGSAGTTILRPTAAPGVPLVSLAGRLERLRIESGTGNGAAVATSCAGGGRPTLTSVDVDGGGALAVGVDLSGSCGADLTEVEISNVSGPALRVGAEAAATVNVHGGALKDSGVGARVTGGKVAFGIAGDPPRGVQITGNTAEGVLLTGVATAIEAQLESASISANGGTGVVVDVVSASSKLTIRGCDVFANGSTAPRAYGGSGDRKAGGVLLKQHQLAAFTFAGNRIYANHADQLGVASSGAWSISPGACGAASNRFACVPDGAYSLSVEGTGSVAASANAWPIEPPDTTVNGNVTLTTYCSTGAGLPTPPQCVAP